MHGDFRSIREPAAQFDKVVSIGCLEHAGRDQLGELIRAHASSLKPGGLGLIHFIGHVGHFETDFFIRKYVFPGGWIPSLAEVIVEMEKAGLEVLDIENLRRHYALTLDVWAERFDRNWERIRALDPKRFDERFRRIWRTYLYGCAEMFRSPAGRTHLFQIVFSKGNVIDARATPMSRELPLRSAQLAACTQEKRSAEPRSLGRAGGAPVGLPRRRRTSSATARRAQRRRLDVQRASTRCSRVDPQAGWVEAEGMITYEELVARLPARTA